MIVYILSSDLTHKSDKLFISRSRFLRDFPSPSGRPYDKLVVGIAIFRFSNDPAKIASPKILLLKRAADETYFPNVFELPSGKVDFSDHCVFSALTRELLEETGLKVPSVVGELNPFTYLTEKTINGQYGTKLASKDCIQLNYVVNADGGEVVVNPKEHSEFVWAPLYV